MAHNLQRFDPRQQMRGRDFELQHKRDFNPKDVDLHHHDFFEIYFLMTGDVTYLIDGKIVHVMPGDLLLIAPQQLHQVCIQPEMSAYERYVLWVDPAVIRRLSSGESDLSLGLADFGHHLRLKAQDRSRVQAMLETLHREADAQDYGSDLLRQSLLTQLLVTVNRLASQQGSWMEEESTTNQAVEQVMGYVNLHYSEPLTLDMLAEQFFVSKYHLSREFQRQMGTSIYHYIQKKRLLIAQQLMDQGKRPNEVYCRCGFNDYTCFYRAFKSEYGISPREYALTTRTRKGNGL